MVIISADDIGKNKEATRSILLCHKNMRITSTSAMVFMSDCEKSADLILESRVDLGLHLNFTLEFDGLTAWRELRERQGRIAAFLLKSKYSSTIYNPMLSKDFEYTVKAQFEEFVRLFGKPPTHIDGHHHQHLCMNVLLSDLIPIGSLVRRNFSFGAGEKNNLNRLYRGLVDHWLKRKHQTTGFFFPLMRVCEQPVSEGIAKLLRDSHVELMIHPEQPCEFDFLMSDVYYEFISRFNTGNYTDLAKLLSRPKPHYRTNIARAF